MGLFGFGNKKRIEAIRQYLEEEQYEKAAQLADEVALHKISSPYEMNLIGRAYKKVEAYAQARDAYERSYAMRASRNILTDIMDCCLAVKDIEAAEIYFDEYQKQVPDDLVTLYAYRYRIEQKRGRDRAVLIAILEELKALEYQEEYAYELAKQYHKAGMAEACMNECKDIILWFGFGVTVERAKALLAYYKGEISLEEIKQAGVRYQEEQIRLQEEEKMQLVMEAATKEEVSEDNDDEVWYEVSFEEPYEEWQEEVQKEVQAEVCAELPEPEETVRIEEPEEEPEMEEVFAAEEESTDEEELPEIDLSVLGFEEAPEPEEKREQITKVPEDLYVPPTGSGDEPETENERLLEMFREKRICLPDILRNYGRMERIRKQIVKSLELVLSERENAYFVITGEKQTGKTTLAHYLVTLLYELEIVRYDHTVTIDAVQLNQIALEEYGSELENSNLIIENAGGMTKGSIDGLIAFSKGCKGKICVILEDSVRDINKFLRAREELNQLFNNRIHLGKYSTEELTGFVYDYIKKEDYSMDASAIPVLQNKINEIIRNYSNDQRLVKTLELAGTILKQAEHRIGEKALAKNTPGKTQTGDEAVVVPEDIV